MYACSRPRLGRNFPVPASLSPPSEEDSATTHHPKQRRKQSLAGLGLRQNVPRLEVPELPPWLSAPDGPDRTRKFYWIVPSPRFLFPFCEKPESSLARSDAARGSKKNFGLCSPWGWRNSWKTQFFGAEPTSRAVCGRGSKVPEILVSICG